MALLNTVFTILACLLDAVCLIVVFYIDKRHRKRFDGWEGVLKKIRTDLDDISEKQEKMDKV